MYICIHAYVFSLMSVTYALPVKNCSRLVNGTKWAVSRSPTVLEVGGKAGLRQICINICYFVRGQGIL